MYTEFVLLLFHSYARWSVARWSVMEPICQLISLNTCMSWHPYQINNILQIPLKWLVCISYKPLKFMSWHFHENLSESLQCKENNSLVTYSTKLFILGAGLTSNTEITCKIRRDC